MKALAAALGALVLALAAGAFYFYNAASSAGGEMDALRRDNLEINQRTASLEQEKAGIAAELATLRADKETFAAQLDQLAQSKNETAAVIEALRKEKEELAQRLAQLEKEKSDAAAQLETQVSQLSVQKEEEVARLKEEADKRQAEKEAEIARLKTTHDQLTAGMKQEIQQGQIKITQLADQLSVSMVDQIIFPSGSADISPEGLKVLQRVGDIIKKAQGKAIRVEGHTDDQPLSWYLRSKFASNWELSTLRASNVVRFLQDKVGIEGTRLKAVGLSEYRPIADNKNPEGRSKNRRIEITLEAAR